MYFKGKKLTENHKTLAEYGIEGGCCVELDHERDQIPARLARVILNLGLIFIWYCFGNHNFIMYEYILGTKFYQENRELVFFEEDVFQKVAR